MPGFLRGVVKVGMSGGGLYLDVLVELVGYDLAWTPAAEVLVLHLFDPLDCVFGDGVERAHYAAVCEGGYVLVWVVFFSLVQVKQDWDEGVWVVLLNSFDEGIRSTYCEACQLSFFADIGI